jgi:hypothetical protein
MGVIQILFFSVEVEGTNGSTSKYLSEWMLFNAKCLKYLSFFFYLSPMKYYKLNTTSNRPKVYFKLYKLSIHLSSR